MSENHNPPKGQASCDVVRDLMALCIEDLCSPASVALVDAHVNDCTECAEIYDALREAPPASLPTPQDDPSFGQAFQQMLRAIRLRGLLLALLVAVLVAGSMYIFNYLFVYGTISVPIGEVDFTLSRLPNGAVLETVDTGNRYLLRGMSWQPSKEEGIIYIQIRSTLAAPWSTDTPSETFYSELQFQDGLLYCGGYESSNKDASLVTWNPIKTEIREIRLGHPNDQNYATVYRQGDEIEPCSQDATLEWEKHVEIPRLNNE